VFWRIRGMMLCWRCPCAEQCNTVKVRFSRLGVPFFGLTYCHCLLVQDTWMCPIRGCHSACRGSNFRDRQGRRVHNNSAEKGGFGHCVAQYRVVATWHVWYKTCARSAPDRHANYRNCFDSNDLKTSLLRSLRPIANMPTTSVAGPLILTNLGPVTTTFTAPGSCATQWKNSQHGFGSEGFPDFIAAGSCDEPLMKSECFPHGDKLLEMQSSLQTALNYEEYFTQPYQPYYSPAWNCPAGWTTAGVAGMADGTASVNGVFSPSGAAENVTSTVEAGIGGPEGYSTITVTETKTPVNFIPNMITSALGTDETAVLCCPRFVPCQRSAQCMILETLLTVRSGYTADAYHAGCLTRFPGSSLSGIEGCFRILTSARIPTETSTLIDTWEFGGQTFTQRHTLWPQPTDYPDGVSKVSYVFDARGHPMTTLANGSSAPLIEGSDSWDGVAFQPFLVLIANGSGTEAGGDITEGGDDDSAASASTRSLWAMGAALFVGFIAAAVL